MARGVTTTSDADPALIDRSWIVTASSHQFVSAVCCGHVERGRGQRHVRQDRRPDPQGLQWTRGVSRLSARFCLWWPDWRFFPSRGLRCGGWPIGPWRPRGPIDRTAVRGHGVRLCRRFSVRWLERTCSVTRRTRRLTWCDSSLSRLPHGSVRRALSVAVFLVVVSCAGQKASAVPKLHRFWGTSPLSPCWARLFSPCSCSPIWALAGAGRTPPIASEAAPSRCRPASSRLQTGSAGYSATAYPRRVPALEWSCDAGAPRPEGREAPPEGPEGGPTVAPEVTRKDEGGIRRWGPPRTLRYDKEAPQVTLVMIEGPDLLIVLAIRARTLRRQEAAARPLARCRQEGVRGRPARDAHTPRAQPADLKAATRQVCAVVQQQGQSGVAGHPGPHGQFGQEQYDIMCTSLLRFSQVPGRSSVARIASASPRRSSARSYRTWRPSAVAGAHDILTRGRQVR